MHNSSHFSANIFVIQGLGVFLIYITWKNNMIICDEDKKTKQNLCHGQMETLNRRLFSVNFQKSFRLTKIHISKDNAFMIKWDIQKLIIKHLMVRVWYYVCVYVYMYIYTYIFIFPGYFQHGLQALFFNTLNITRATFDIQLCDFSQPMVVHSDSYTSGFQYGANCNSSPKLMGSVF